MGFLEAILIAVVAGLAPSPHSLFLAMVASQGRGRGVFLGGIVADVMIVMFCGLVVFSGRRLMGEYFSALGILMSLIVAMKLFAKRGPQHRKSRWQNFEGSFLQGLMVQLLNPNPYLFWAGIFFPSLKTTAVLEPLLVGLSFSTIVHTLKWYIYAHWTQRLSQFARLLLARSAFVAFIAVYAMRSYWN